MMTTKNDISDAYQKGRLAYVADIPRNAGMVGGLGGATIGNAMTNHHYYRHRYTYYPYHRRYYNYHER